MYAYIYMYISIYVYISVYIDSHIFVIANRTDEFSAFATGCLFNAQPHNLTTFGGHFPTTLACRRAVTSEHHSLKTSEAHNLII